MKVKASDIIKTMQGWIGLSRSKGTHKPIVDIYNSHLPLARGYKVKYSDAYCATTVSAAFIKNDAVDMLNRTECGCEEFIKIFKSFGIWNEDGTITPNPGDIVLYNWEIKTQPNNGTADHIGIVETVDELGITVIEGNIGGNVGRRVIPIGYGCIRGYAQPRYLEESNPEITKGWHQSADTGKWWYQYDETKDGYFANTVEKINGKLYAFDSNGWMCEGEFKVKADDTGALSKVGD